MRLLPWAIPPIITHSYLAAKAKLCRCGLSLAELAHLIEKAECDLFLATNVAVRPKEYRHNFPAERARVVREIQSAWAATKGIAAPIELLIDDATTDLAAGRMPTQPLDGYDLLFLEAMTKAGVAQILTDDGDYCTVPGIQVFTANRQAINAARDQGKLLKR